MNPRRRRVAMLWQRCLMIVQHKKEDDSSIGNYLCSFRSGPHIVENATRCLTASSFAPCEFPTIPEFQWKKPRRSGANSTFYLIFD